MNLKSIEKCHSLLGKKLRIRIHDGRIIEGILQAIDREMNLLLESAREFHGVLESKFFKSMLGIYFQNF